MPPRIDLLPENGRYFKANLHSHTTISDGKWTPEELKAQYKTRGYSVVAVSDHNRFVRYPGLCDDDFFALPAFEADISRVEDVESLGWRRVRTWHFNFFAEHEGVTEEDVVPKPASYDDVEGINAYIAQMRENGFLCSYNHPYWSLQTSADFTALRGLFAMEIYNHGCEKDGLYGYAPQAYDEMLRAGRRLCCLATDDNHNRVGPNDPYSDSFGGFTMLCCQSLNHAGVMDALKQGRFYASQGPEIKALWVEGDQVTVRTSPAKKIYLGTEGRDCQYMIAPAGQTIEQAGFTLKGGEAFFRVTVKDGEGRFANTNAYFTDALKTT